MARPVYSWNTDTTDGMWIDMGVETIRAVSRAGGSSEEIVEARVAEFLAGAHEKFPHVVLVEHEPTKPQLRLVKG
jgi:hypothetical protein